MKKWCLLGIMMALNLHAGKLQPLDPFKDPADAFNQMDEQFQRMWSTIDRQDLHPERKIKLVARYVQDIEERLGRLEQNRIDGTFKVENEDMDILWYWTEKAKNYCENDESVEFDSSDEYAPEA